MKLPDDNRLADALSRGKLTAQQELELQAYLALHPEQGTEIEEELALNQLLNQVPDAPLPSNFTALVLAAAASRAQTPSSGRFVSVWERARQWLPRLAALSAVLCLSLVAYHQHEAAVARRELARNLATVSELAPVPEIELLKNFDAIQRLGQAPVESDRELIAALR